MPVDEIRQQDLVVRGLRDPAAHERADGGVEHIETHISHVFLAGDRAYKLKKPVHFAFVDYRGVECRRRMCEHEFKRNRRGAPDLYLGVMPVTRRDDGGVRVGGDGPALDWVVVMRRFDGDALFSTMIDDGRLTTGHVDLLARRIADYHDEAPVVAAGEDHGGGSAGAEELHSTLDELGARDDLLPKTDLERLRRSSEAQLAAQSARLDARLAAGCVRHVHGDLHLRNVCWVDGQPMLFDSIEFNDRLAVIDTMYDLAFVLMDLMARGRRDLANALLNRYFVQRWDADGLALLPLYLSARAAIRAKVAVEQLDEGAGDRDALAGQARRYLSLAAELADASSGRVIAVGGLSGTGKSTVARALAPRIDPAPGAVVLRTDVVRKQMAGLAETDHMPRSAYTPEHSRRVYDRVNGMIAEVADAGHSVICDAVYADPGERRDTERVAREAGRPFHGIWLQLDLESRLRRVDTRGDRDASDADTTVARAQQDQDVGALDWVRVDAGGETPAVVEAVERAINAPDA